MTFTISGLHTLLVAFLAGFGLGFGWCAGRFMFQWVSDMCDVAWLWIACRLARRKAFPRGAVR